MQGKAFPYVGQGYAEYVAQIIRATRKCGLRYYAVSRNFIGGIFMESNRKSKIFKGVAVGALALIVAALSVLGIWAVRKNKTESMPVDFSRDNGGMIVADSGKNTGIRLMSKQLDVSEYAVNAVSATADSAFVITATITPDTATNQAITCKPAFTNPESEWATGKTLSDYVTTSVSSLKITVTCLQPFGEQITLTVTSQDNPNAKASCTLDYLKRIATVTATLADGTQLVNYDDIDTDGKSVYSPSVVFDLNASTTQKLVCNIVEGTGTISGNYSVTKITMDLSDVWLSGPFDNSMIPLSEFGCLYYAADGASSELSSNPIDVTSGFALDVTTWKHFFGEKSVDADNLAKFKQYMSYDASSILYGLQMVKLAYGVFNFEVTVQGQASTTSGKTFSKTVKFPVSVNVENMEIGVSSLTNDTQDYVF